MHTPLGEVSIHDTYVYLSAEGRWFVLAWLTVLGAIFGSFMNVIIYRLPRHMSLSHPGSRCPACEHPIRWHDNVPIVGWLKLRGRCRDCGAPISPRYPLVEALVAATSALVAWTEGMPEIALGAPEPGGTFEIRLGMYAFHLLLVGTLICAAMMEFDGHPLPARMWISVLMVGLVAPLFRPDLRSTGIVIVMPDGQIGGPSWVAFVNGLAGFVAALTISVVPWVTWFSQAKTSKPGQATSAAAGLLLVGTFLGGGAVIMIGVASMALHLATRLLAHNWPAIARFGWAGSLTLVTLVWIVNGAKVLRFEEIIAGNEAIWAITGGLLMAAMAIALQLMPAADPPIQKS